MPKKSSVKLHEGPRGGVYYVRNGTRHYVTGTVTRQGGGSSSGGSRGGFVTVGTVERA